MNEIKRLKLNLQHFAEDDDIKKQEPDDKKDDKQKSGDKEVFEITQNELDSQKHKAVNKALANQEKKFEQRLKEAVENARSEGESYAKLTQKEKEEKEKKAAMDANTIRQQITAEFKSKNEAARKIRDLVGEVDAMAFDSANDIYAHALKQKGVDIKKYEPAAYKGMVDIMVTNKPSQVPVPTFDHDTTSFDGQFAGLKNIKI